MPTPSSPGTASEAFENAARPCEALWMVLQSLAPELSLQSLQHMGTPPLSSTKEETAVAIFTCDWEFSPLTISIFFFGILTLACISLLLPLPVSSQQLSAFPSRFLVLPSPPLPSLVGLMLFRSFFGGTGSILVKFF